MLAEEGLAYFMTHDPVISALIGDRFEPLVVPQEKARPAIAHQRITTPPERSHSGRSKPDHPTIQLTIEGSTYAEAKRLAKTITDRLDGFKGMMGSLEVQDCLVNNIQDGYGQIKQVPVVRMDIELWCVEV